MHCTKCGYEFDTHAAADGSDARPTDGSWMICLACGHVMVARAADGEFTVRDPTPKEATLIWNDANIQPLLIMRDFLAATQRDWPRGPRG